MWIWNRVNRTLTKPLFAACLFALLTAPGVMLAALTSVAHAQTTDPTEQPDQQDSDLENETDCHDRGAVPTGEQPSDQLQQSEQEKPSDPVLVWPDPINESQLGNEAIYYHYARDDGRSLLRVPTPDNPLRIWIGGDSMAGGASYGLTTLLGSNPNYEVVSEIRKSTGNVADWFFNWPQHMSDVVAEAGYDLIVLSIGANDKQKFSGVGADVGDPQWLELYRDRVTALLDAAIRPGRLVVWVGLPHMQPGWLRALPDTVNPEVLASIESLGEVLFIDAAAILSPDGHYVRRLGGEHGNRTVRTADGVHYTFYGGKLVSEPIVAEIVRRTSEPGCVR